ncbi:MAG: UDP-3-O-(3-hydroxymyristoyl)glucosamine N-acyltransferase [Deltaproteobacteria bacterium]|nr:UDP-3-O-(3-hydroxymyristoyl)glucosamine N-acyltransferase [Deltaproteobacteria bacterium]
MVARLRELAALVGGEVVGPGEVEIAGVAGIDHAGEGDLTFVASARYARRLQTCPAAAAIATGPVPGLTKPVLVGPNPYLAFARLLAYFHPPRRESPGVDSRAVLAPDVRLGRDVTIGPFVYVGAGSVLGDRVVLHPGVYVGERCVLGEDTVVHPNACLLAGSQVGRRVVLHPGCVIGSEGFGYARDGAAYVKIPQIGRVVLEDDVEVGANATIDRATQGETRIRRGTKIDNLVMVAHNVTIGEDTVIAGQAGIAGSSTVGSRVIIAGQVGIGDHLAVGDAAVLSGRAGVIGRVPPGGTWSGHPARPHREWLRREALISRLPGLQQALAALERRVRELEARLVADRRG